jgi:hypothetical protein
MIYCNSEARPGFYSWSEPVARKEHRCCECFAPILPGEKHFYVRGKWEGSLMAFRQHTLCRQACELIRDKLDGECICFGSLLDWYGEYRREDWQGKAEAWKEFRALLARILWRKRGRGCRRRRKHDPI